MIILNENTIGGLKIFPNDTSQPDQMMPIPNPLVNSDDDSASIGVDLSTDETAMSQIARDSGFLWDRLVPVNDISHGFDFAYDFKEQNIYWLQHNQSSYSLDIQRVKFDGENREVFVSNGISKIFESFSRFGCDSNPGKGPEKEKVYGKFMSVLGTKNSSKKFPSSKTEI